MDTRANLRGVRTLLASLALLWLLGSVGSAATETGIVTSERNAMYNQDGVGVGYASVLYDSSNGLPTSEANDIVQSADGFLWIGSYSGLIRYDSNTFQRYEGVTSVKCLFSDSRGRLWIGTNDHGLFMLQDEVFTLYDRSEGLNSSFVQAIAEDADGNIFVATTMGVNYVDASGTVRRLDDARLNMEYIVDILLSPDGALYGSTNTGAFFSIRDCQVTSFYDGEELGFQNAVNAIYPDFENPGFVYLGTHGSEVIHGDMVRGMSGWTSYSIAPLKTVQAMNYVDGQIWLCAENGIGFLDETRRFTKIQNIPMTTQVHRMARDYQGNLWFASTRQGVMKIVRNRFTDVFIAAELPSLVVNSTCMYRGELYVGTDSGLKILNKDYEPVENALSARMEGIRIRSIRTDSQGRLWLGTNSPEGLVRYDGATDSVYNYNETNGMPSNRARVMMELSDGAIAVATNEGVVMLNDGEISSVYGSAQGLNNLEILCLEEGPDGRMYMGSDGDGIYVADVRRSKTVTRLGLDDGLESEVILRIKRDAEDPDLYWVVTSNSIAWMKDEQITTLRNFPYSNNFDLYFTRDGMIWILSSNGIYVVQRTELLRDAPGLDYTLFDTACGLPSVATANSYSYLGDDGILYIAGSKGVSAVDLYNDTEENSAIMMSVPYLTVDDAYFPIHDGPETHIPHNCKRLVIYPFVFTYSLNNPHVTFWLEGFDDSPVSVTKRELAPVGYTNLDGGTYRFHLSILNANTGEEAQSLVVTIVKEKGLMEREWFVTLCILCMVFLGAALVTLYFRRKTQILLKEQAKTKELVWSMTRVFAKCVDMKDAYTNGHSARVARYSCMLARQMGMSKAQVDNLRNIALLHDIGKISIPDNILNKPGRLTDEEFAVMRSHSQKGFDILKEITIAPELAIGAGYHHERIDGKGYPRGLKGDEIPLIARIIAVADAFDAMYSTRPYRRKMKLEDVIAEIKRSSGTQLSPDVVKAFMELADQGAFGQIEATDAPPPPEAT